VSGARIYTGQSRDCSRIERNPRPNSDTWASGRFISRRDMRVGGAARYSTEAKHPTPQQANRRGGDDKMPVDCGRTYLGIGGELDSRQPKHNAKESCGSARMEVSRAEHPETPGRRSARPLQQHTISRINLTTGTHSTRSPPTDTSPVLKY